MCVCVLNCLTEPKQDGEQTKFSVGEIFHVISSLSDERDGINGRDCSLPATAAANVAELDIDMVCLKSITLLLASLLSFFFKFRICLFRRCCCCCGFQPVEFADFNVME